MREPASLANHIRFGVFEVDLRTGELRKQGLKLKLQIQPFRILEMLLDRPGELITREEIRERLWPADTFIDFEHSVNSSIKKLREVLCDDAEKPRYIETLPRRGYRFIAPVEAVDLSKPLTPVPSPRGRGEMNSDLQPSPLGRGSPDLIGTGEGSVAPLSSPAPLVAGAPPHPLPSLSTGGFARRAITAVVQGALDAHRAQTRWQRLAVAGVALTVLALGLAILIALNVAGLRDRVSRAVGAVREPPLPKIESIAVLPLENLSRDPEQEYFADGMTEELITNLGKVRALRVISRTTAMHYKGTKKALPEIAKELNVDAVVEGSVLRSGNRVRVTANLLYAPTDRHLWAQTYESEMQDVLVLQGEMARTIVEEVRIVVEPQDQARLATTRPMNPEAYEAFLKGRHFWDIQTPDGQLKCVEYYEQVIQKEPAFALAYAHMAHCYDMLAYMEVAPARVYQQKARAAAQKALALDDQLAEAHMIFADQKYWVDWDWAAGEAAFRRAMELNPGSEDVVGHYGVALEVQGRFAEAIPVFERAAQLDPLSLTANSFLATALFNAHQDERAIAQYQKAIELNPENAGFYDGLGSVYESTGKYDLALAAHLKAARLSHASPELVQLLENASGAEGLRALRTYWRKRNREQLKKAKRQQPSPYIMAAICTSLGEKEQALEWLEKAYQQHTPMLLWLKAARHWDPLRSEPGYQALLRRMNFPP